MKITELIPFIDPNQRIIIEKSSFGQIFKGTAREFNHNNMLLGNLEILQIYLDKELYSSGHIKIRVWKQGE